MAAKKKVARTPRVKIPWEEIARWFMSGETGESAKTILDAAFDLWQGARNKASYPHDKSDFGRCLRLLKVVPQVKDLLHKVGTKHPKEWGGILLRWDYLVKLHNDEKVDYNEFAAAIKNAQATYAEAHHAKEQLGLRQKQVCFLMEHLRSVLEVSRKGEVSEGDLAVLDDASSYLEILDDDAYEDDEDEDEDEANSCLCCGAKFQGQLLYDMGPGCYSMCTPEQCWYAEKDYLCNNKPKPEGYTAPERPKPIEEAPDEPAE